MYTCSFVCGSAEYTSLFRMLNTVEHLKKDPHNKGHFSISFAANTNNGGKLIKGRTSSLRNLISITIT